MSGQSDITEIVVYITASSEDEATLIARSLVEARLAACVNIINNVRSIYSWHGKIEDDSEVLMLAKTRKELFSKLTEKVIQLHSYDVPEIIATPVIDGSKEYLDWLRKSTGF